jgi:hypothetical protein
MKNKWYEKDGYAVILVRHKTEFKECLVDLEDIPKLEATPGTWTAFNEGSDIPYAKQKINKKIARIHKFILGTNSNQIIDHINRNTFDNRKENLRVVSSSANAQNRVYKNKTGARNVHKDKNLYRVIMKINGKTRHFGRFKTIEEASKRAKEMRAKYLPYSTE